MGNTPMAPFGDTGEAVAPATRHVARRVPRGLWCVGNLKGDRMKSVAAGVLAGLLGMLPPALGQGASIFVGADMVLGQRLIAEHKCVACHQQKVGGDGNAIYKPAGRINSAGFLRGMVEQCNTELNLGLFPDEVTAVAAVLNRDHYRFR